MSVRMLCFSGRVRRSIPLRAKVDSLAMGNPLLRPGTQRGASRTSRRAGPRHGCESVGVKANESFPLPVPGVCPSDPLRRLLRTEQEIPK